MADTRKLPNSVASQWSVWPVPNSSRRSPYQVSANEDENLCSSRSSQSGSSCEHPEQHQCSKLCCAKQFIDSHPFCASTEFAVLPKTIASPNIATESDWRSWVSVRRPTDIPTLTTASSPLGVIADPLLGTRIGTRSSAHDPSPGLLRIARICRCLAVSRKPVSSCRVGLNWV
jgi:hypothetical protein